MKKYVTLLKNKLVTVCASVGGKGRSTLMNK